MHTCLCDLRIYHADPQRTGARRQGTHGRTRCGEAPGQALFRDMVARLPLLTHRALTTHAVGIHHDTDPPLTACAQVCAGRARTHIPADVQRARACKKDFQERTHARQTDTRTLTSRLMHASAFSVLLASPACSTSAGVSVCAVPAHS